MKLHFMKSYCYPVPVLLYALECFKLSSTCVQACRTQFIGELSILSRGNL